jgi:hypothetical protein
VSEASRQWDYWITAAEEPAGILRRYADVTGRPPLLPEWASGFWQCKLRYRTQQELLDVAREYKRRGLPLSVIVVDYFHWTRQGEWRFDPGEWPDPADIVVREVQEQRAHRRKALGMRRPHRAHDVGPQVLPQAEPPAEDLVGLGAEGPQLVRRSGLLGPGHHDGLPDPVQAAQRAEHPELEPPDQQFAERGGLDVAALEPADVGGPPADAGQADVQPAEICRRRSSKVESMSPDQTAAPYRWLPAQAARQSNTASSSPSPAMPSWKAFACSSG